MQITKPPQASLTTILIKNQVADVVQTSKAQNFKPFLLLSQILVESSIPGGQMRSKG